MTYQEAKEILEGQGHKQIHIRSYFQAVRAMAQSNGNNLDMYLIDMDETDLTDDYDDFQEAQDPCPVEFYPPVITEGDDEDCIY